MSKNKKRKKEKFYKDYKNERGSSSNNSPKNKYSFSSLHPDIQRSVLIVLFFGLGIVFLLAGLGQAGPWGVGIHNGLTVLFGWGYYLVPFVFFLLAFSLISGKTERLLGISSIAAFLFMISTLGLIDIAAPKDGGVVGEFVGLLKKPFGIVAAVVIIATVCIVSLILTINRPLLLFRKKEKIEEEPIIKKNNFEQLLPLPNSEIEQTENKKEIIPVATSHGETDVITKKGKVSTSIKNYIAPPLSLISSSVEKPTSGDLQANANIIKRTFDSFGISVEMGEINVGPTITRYTLKPAEGMRLSRITALHQDLALALAAHPIRIEAPIPGKSLVGIEMPNKTAALVRLGSLLLYPEFQKTGDLSFALGRTVSGDPLFPEISKMPHVLIAGATGSGKSITVHSMILSLLFKNSPEMLGFIMVDPKRVELSVYEGIPHLLAPVITDTKKAMGVLKWAIDEMDRRYEILLESGCRDIKSYRKIKNDLPYIMIIIDELADLMATYGREVEGSIIRLAQMARATGIHLVLATQRPSVEVITGLIKANITTRIALQVASQIDSRTILDSAGAEKLLGKGDLLYISAELSKPVRLQGTFVTEEEIKKVAQFIKDNNKPIYDEVSIVENINPDESKIKQNGMISFEKYEGNNGDDDELYEEAIEIVRQAKKASASLLQRRLKVGYARAARLIDMMEERGVVGPGEGAKPRDVYL